MTFQQALSLAAKLADETRRGWYVIGNEAPYQVVDHLPPAKVKMRLACAWQRRDSALAQKKAA